MTSIHSVVGNVKITDLTADLTIVYCFGGSQFTTSSDSGPTTLHDLSEFAMPTGAKAAVYGNKPFDLRVTYKSGKFRVLVSDEEVGQFLTANSRNGDLI